MTEACISLRVVRTDIMEDRESEKDKKEGKVFKSFLLEFTAPRFFNEVIRRIIERRLCDGVSRVTNFKHIKFAERLVASC